MKSIFKKVCIASDHAGFKLKDQVLDFLISKNISVIDLGPSNDNSVDYPDFAKKVSGRVKSKKSDVGILVCGSGTGMAISANKIRGIRAANCFNIKSSYLCRSRNNVNVLCLGARIIKNKDVMKIVKAFLTTKFEGGRHKRRLKKFY